MLRLKYFNSLVGNSRTYNPTTITIQVMKSDKSLEKLSALALASRADLSLFPSPSSN